MLCGASAMEENVKKMFGRSVYIYIYIYIYIHKTMLWGEAEVRSMWKICTSLKKSSVDKKYFMGR
jgi:hypothetical protein